MELLRCNGDHQRMQCKGAAQGGTDCDSELCLSGTLFRAATTATRHAAAHGGGRAERWTRSSSHTSGPLVRRSTRVKKNGAKPCLPKASTRRRVSRVSISAAAKPSSKPDPAHSCVVGVVGVVVGDLLVLLVRVLLRRLARRRLLVVLLLLLLGVPGVGAGIGRAGGGGGAGG